MLSDFKLANIAILLPDKIKGVEAITSLYRLGDLYRSRGSPKTEVDTGSCSPYVTPYSIWNNTSEKYQTDIYAALLQARLSHPEGYSPKFSFLTVKTKVQDKNEEWYAEKSLLHTVLWRVGRLVKILAQIFDLLI